MSCLLHAGRDWTPGINDTRNPGRTALDAARLTRTLEEGLAEIPLLDVQTHLDAGHLSARGLDDVLL
jgi:hypothetical protein